MIEIEWEGEGRVSPTHPFGAEITAAQRSGDVTELARAISLRFGVPVLHPTIVEYARVSVARTRARGGLGLRGVGDALARPITAESVFGRFDGLLPALAVGERNGVTLHASLASGRLITLHHDATFYEVAGRVSAQEIAGAMRAFEALGSAISLEQLFALQSELVAAFGDDPPSGPLYARVVLDVLALTPADGRRCFETTPYEFLGLRAEDCDDLPKPGARKLAPRKPAPRARKPRPVHPRVARHLERHGRDAITLDLSSARLDRLPEEILDLSHLQVLDLSDNPKLDLGAVCDALASLPRLRELRFARCKLDVLPPSFAKLRGIESLDLTGYGFGRTSNLFDMTRSLEVAAQLPALRSLVVCTRYIYGNAQNETVDEVLSSTAFDALESLTLTCPSVKELAGALRSKRRLTQLELREVGDRSLGVLAELPLLEDLTLSRAHELAVPSAPIRRLSIDRCAAADTTLADLPNLRELELRGLYGAPRFPTLHRDARLSRLVLESRDCEDWGSARDRLGEVEALEVRGFDGAPTPLPPLGARELPSLRELDVGFLSSGSWRFDPREPFAKLEVLLAKNQALPEWLRGSDTLRRVRIPEVEAERGLELALTMPAVEWIEGWWYETPIRVPSAASFAARTSLARFEFTGQFADPVAAYDAIAAAPNLAHLHISQTSLAKLPRALGARPLETLFYSGRRGLTPLDPSDAFRLLASTPLAELRLSNVSDVPEELGLLKSLERLVLDDPIPPKLPVSALGGLPKLEMIRYLSAKVVGPERKRLEAALPACVIQSQ